MTHSCIDCEAMVGIALATAHWQGQLDEVVHVKYVADFRVIY